MSLIMGKGKQLCLTTAAIYLNLTAIVCFCLWFVSVYITLREDVDDWKLLLGFGVPSITMRFIPLVFLSHILKSNEFVEFWEIPENDLRLEKRDGNFDVKNYYKQRFSFVKKTMIAGLLAFLYAWSFFSIINKRRILSLLAILSFTIEGFCTAELLKARHGTLAPALQWAGGGAVDFGLFKFVAGTSVCTAQRLFGFKSGYMWCVFLFCLILIGFHTYIPTSRWVCYADQEAQNVKQSDNT